MERLKEVIRRVNQCPLGCGALAGNAFEVGHCERRPKTRTLTTLQVDRGAMAEELGFDGLMPNSMAAVGDRKFVVETMSWASELMGDISRISEDLIIYSNTDFGFVQLADAYCTGSSLMPQKKNPDSLELLRGKSGRVMGQMTGLIMTTKGIPSTYNKDLQESVEPMLDCVKTVSDSVQILTGVLSTLIIRPARMRAALTPDMLATDLADYLVRKNVPFRETHHISGRVVALAEEKGIPMNKLTTQDLQSVDNRIGTDFAFDYEHSVEVKSSVGGTAKKSVLEQIKALKG